MGRYDDAAADFARALDRTPASRLRSSPRSTLLMNLAAYPRSYDELMKLRPYEALLWAARGRYHAVRDEWNDAASDFDHSVGSAPPESEEWFEHACLRLIIGDNGGYRAFVREVQQRGANEDPFGRVRPGAHRGHDRRTRRGTGPAHALGRNRQWRVNATRGTSMSWASPIFAPAVSTRRSSGWRSQTNSHGVTSAPGRTGSCSRWPTTAWVTRSKRVPCSRTCAAGSREFKPPEPAARSISPQPTGCPYSSSVARPRP